MEYVNFVLTYEQKFNKDVKYINNELICEQTNGKLCKYSTYISGITVLDKPKQEYIKYWTQLYRDNKEYKGKIEQVCKNKLQNGLVSKEDMIQLIQNGKDSIKEKKEALSKLI